MLASNLRLDAANEICRFSCGIHIPACSPRIGNYVDWRAEIAAAELMAKAQPRRPNRYFSRDESWMSFNRRVLQEAQDSSNPLLERVKFLAITASNLDEFVEIRLAGVLQRIEDGYKERGPDGLTPQETLDKLVDDMHDFVRGAVRVLERPVAAGALRQGCARSGLGGTGRRGAAAGARVFISEKWIRC